MSSFGLVVDLMTVRPAVARQQLVVCPCELPSVFFFPPLCCDVDNEEFI